MCGIFGIVSKQQLDLSAMVGKMATKLVHRGPDDEGFYSDSIAMLGNRRLSIIDIARGHQPIFSDDLSVIIVQNGEIYNYIELRQELINRGVSFRTDCDTEVILKLYEVYGKEFVTQLNGMFSIAIWDKNTKEMHLYRDRLGIKPLFIADTEAGICFASEIKALLALGIPVTPRVEAIHHYLSFNFVPPSTTMFEGIENVPAGGAVTIAGGKIHSWRWWNPSFVTIQKSDAQWIEEFRDTLADAVRIHLRSDVEVGAFLSGGIDSSSIVALAAPHIKPPMHSFSIGFNEARFDESAYAISVAKKYNTLHHNEMLGSEMMALWPKVIHHCEQPHGDASFIPTYALSQLAAKKVKVVVTGDGSDELFAGYERYVPFIEKHSKDKNDDFERAYFANQGLLSQDEKLELYAPHWQKYFTPLDSFELMQNDFAEVRSLYPVNRISWMDMRWLLPANNLIKPDRMGMAFGLEARVPFLDSRVIDLALSMPSSLKLRGNVGKYILKEAMKDLLPTDVINRPKQMFTVPIGEWFKGHLAPLLKQVLLSERAIDRGLFNRESLQRLIAEHVSGQGNHTRILRALMALEIWCRLFIDGENYNEFPEFASLQLVTA
jgi:asparagine synthase (glutamine-hydrolysing)